ncbi:MAG: sigma-54 dependent transcriptional regulator [Verrucomicrobia bacterium]|nr:sigma-54 dependent transcriptional regulator [Verrucomicrobiota bacterium]
MARILVVEDEPGVLSVLTKLLRGEGYDVTPAPGGDKAQDILKKETFDLLISDVRMSPVDGMELLKYVRQAYPQMGVIMMTAYGSVQMAVDAMKQGAFDYVTKPFKVDELLLTVQRAVEYNSIVAENVQLKAELAGRSRFENIVAESASMRAVCEMIEKVAPSDTTVLIRGDSGTGKELVAKAIHAYSNRKAKAFVPINCAALPEHLLESELFGHVKGAFTGAAGDKEGLFEVASGGTLFLDEIGSMPLGIQGKLLRALQEKEIRAVGGTKTVKVDVRLLAASNERLESLIEKGTFREDLYYRLSVIPIEIAPLRERKDDILPMAYHILRREYGTSKQLPELDPEVQLVLERYSWPGNVRELENALRHACTFARENRITLDVLPAKIVQAVEMGHGMADPGGAPGEFKIQSLKGYLRNEEKEYLARVLEHLHGDKDKAAQLLKVSLATLYRKLPEPTD